MCKTCRAVSSSALPSNNNTKKISRITTQTYHHLRFLFSSTYHRSLQSPRWTTTTNRNDLHEPYDPHTKTGLRKTCRNSAGDGPVNMEVAPYIKPKKRLHPDGQRSILRQRNRCCMSTGTVIPVQVVLFAVALVVVTDSFRIEDLCHPLVYSSTAW